MLQLLCGYETCFWKTATVEALCGTSCYVEGYAIGRRHRNECRARVERVFKLTTVVAAKDLSYT